jgi:hypothetical protein
LISCGQGAAWVDEVGIDGYYRLSTDTIASLFGPTFNAVGKFAPGKPVLIAETGAAPQPGKARAVLISWPMSTGTT